MARLFMVSLVCMLIYFFIVHKAPVAVRRNPMIRYFGLGSMGMVVICIILLMGKQYFS